MDKILKLYTYEESSTSGIPFPNDDEQIIISNFAYDAGRMSAAPTISATVKHRLCLDDLWNDKVYATFRGEKYFIMNTPSSDKDNTDERYKHDIELLSEREVLNHVYFIDAVQGDSTVDVYKSNSTKVIFFGDVNEFVGRLNACLSYQKLDYTAVVDEGVVSEDKQVSFEDKYILEALQEIFNVYEIPYYFVGKVIHVGYTENTITYPLKYGFDEALLSISKQNANYALINKIKGQGSSDNIPYYYPNNSPKGDIGIKIVSGSMIASNFVIFDYVKFSSAMSLTDVCTVRREQSEDGILNYFIWSIDGKDVELSDLGIRLSDNVIPMAGSSFKQEKVSYITPMPNLMPSIYRESLGAQQFYEAKNNTYEDGEGGYYEFENEYSDTNQRQGTTDFEDIKPTIEGITNASGQRIDMFSEFAYDENDNDETDDEGNYIHSYFFAKLRKFDGENGFNLFDHAIESQAMQISFTSGVCGACTFEIGVGEETQKNIVQVDEFGNLKRDEEGNVLWENQSPQDRQNDTRNYEVWIALKKEDSTYGIVFPNVSQNLKPSTSDTFVVLGIDLPTAYITAAEKRLEQSLIKYMWMNNTEKFTFSIKFSRIFFTEHPEVLEQLNENSRVLIEYNGQQHTLYVDNFSYKTDDSSPLPEIEIDLVDTLSVGQNSLQTQLDSVKQDILSSIGGGGDFLKQGLKYFLRKDVNDVAKGKITFRKGLEVGKYTSGELGSGGAILVDTNGNSHAEVDYLNVRKKALFTEIDVQELRHIGGSLIISPAAMIISRVEELVDGYKCYFNTTDDGGKKIYNQFEVGDQARCQTFNLEQQGLGQTGNIYWWRLVTEVGDDYISVSKNDCDARSTIPAVGDNVSQLGNRTDATRQNAQIYSAYGSDAPSRKMYQGINSYSLVGKDIKSEYYDTTTGRFKDVTYGDFYVGDREGNTYLQYDQEEGVGIKGKVDVTYGSTGAANFNDLPEEVQKAVHVGSVNLLLNSGFTGNYETDDLESNTRLTSDYEMYSRALLNWTGTATVQEDVSAKSGRSATIGSISQSVELIEGEYYVISFKAKGTSVTVSCGSYSVSQSLRNEYTRYVFKFTHSGTNVFLISGNATVCDLQLERGTIATDWKPSPLDNDKSMAEFQALQYIAGAIKDGSVDIAGGLILANMLMLGNYKDGVLQKVTAVISGIYNDDDDVAAAFGGNYEQAIYTVMKYKENPLYVPTEEELLSMAKAVITHGGRAIFNDVVVRGYIYALGGFFRGKIETATDGTRIEINPETNSLCMYNQDNRLVLRLNFSTEELSTGAINYYPSLRMYKYSDSKLVSTTTLGTQNLQFSTYIDKDLYDVSLSALTGLTFAKNGEITKVFGPEYETNN